MKCVRMVVTDLRGWENTLAQLRDEFPTLVLNSSGKYEKTLWWELESESETSEAEVAARIDSLLGDCIYAYTNHGLAELLLDALRRQGRHLSLAESLSGGKLADAVVTVVGASDVLLEGIVAYTNAAKETRLNVSHAMLQQYGAVSPQVAQAMAQGLLTTPQAYLGVSTTGIAGPVGDGVCSTVGLTYIGVATPDGCQVYQHQFAGERAAVREQSVAWALFHAYKYIQA